MSLPSPPLSSTLEGQVLEYVQSQGGKIRVRQLPGMVDSLPEVRDKLAEPSRRLLDTHCSLPDTLETTLSVEQVLSLLHDLVNAPPPPTEAVGDVQEQLVQHRAHSVYTPGMIPATPGVALSPRLRPVPEEESPSRHSSIMMDPKLLAGTGSTTIADSPWPGTTPTQFTIPSATAQIRRLLPAHIQTPSNNDAAVTESPFALPTADAADNTAASFRFFANNLHRTAVDTARKSTIFHFGELAQSPRPEADSVLVPNNDAEVGNVTDKSMLEWMNAEPGNSVAETPAIFKMHPAVSPTPTQGDVSIRRALFPSNQMQARDLTDNNGEHSRANEQVLESFGILNHLTDSPPSKLVHEKEARERQWKETQQALANDLEQKNSLIADLESRLETMHGTIRNITQDLEKTQTAGKEQSEKAQSLDQTCKMLMRDLDTWKNTNEDLQKQLVSAKEENEYLKQVHRKDEQDAAEFVRRLELLESELNATKLHNEQLQSALGQTELEMQRFREIEEQLRVANEERERLSAQKERLRKDMEDLQMLAKQTEQVDEPQLGGMALSAQLAQHLDAEKANPDPRVPMESQEITGLRLRISDLEEQLGEAECRCQALQQELQMNSGLREHVQQLEAQVSQLRQELTEARGSVKGDLLTGDDGGVFESTAHKDANDLSQQLQAWGNSKVVRALPSAGTSFAQPALFESPSIRRVPTDPSRAALGSMSPIPMKELDAGNNSFITVTGAPTAAELAKEALEENNAQMVSAAVQGERMGGWLETIGKSVVALENDLQAVMNEKENNNQWDAIATDRIALIDIAKKCMANVLQKNIQELQRFATSNTKLKEKMERLRAQRMHAAAQIEKLSHEKERLLEKMSVYEAEVDRMTAELKGKDDMIGLLRTELAEMKHTNQELEALVDGQMDEGPATPKATPSTLFQVDKKQWQWNDTELGSQETGEFGVSSSGGLFTPLGSTGKLSAIVLKRNHETAALRMENEKLQLILSTTQDANRQFAERMAKVDPTFVLSGEFAPLEIPPGPHAAGARVLPDPRQILGDPMYANAPRNSVSRKSCGVQTDAVDNNVLEDGMTRLIIKKVSECLEKLPTDAPSTMPESLRRRLTSAVPTNDVPKEIKPRGAAQTPFVSRMYVGLKFLVYTVLLLLVGFLLGGGGGILMTTSMMGGGSGSGNLMMTPDGFVAYPNGERFHTHDFEVEVGL